MLRLISDQNFNGRILRGLRRRLPEVDLVRAFDLALDRATDPDFLRRAAEEDRIVLTHDVNTMPKFAYDRVRAALAMPGVFLVAKTMPIGQAIDELLLAVACYSADEVRNLVTYFPL